MESWRQPPHNYYHLRPPVRPYRHHHYVPCCLPICLIGVCLSFRETTDGYMWSSGISFVARDLLLAWVKQLHERQRPSTSFDFPSFTLLPSLATTTTTGLTPPLFMLPGGRPTTCRTLLDPFPGWNYPVSLPKAWLSQMSLLSDVHSSEIRSLCSMDLAKPFKICYIFGIQKSTYFLFCFSFFATLLFA